MTNEQLAILLEGIEAQLNTALGQVSRALNNCGAVRHKEYKGSRTPFLDTNPKHYALTGDFVALDYIKGVRNMLTSQIEILTETQS